MREPTKTRNILEIPSRLYKCGVSHSGVSGSFRVNFTVVIMSWLIKALDTAEVPAFDLFSSVVSLWFIISEPPVDMSIQDLTTLGC